MGRGQGKSTDLGNNVRTTNPSDWNLHRNRRGFYTSLKHGWEVMPTGNWYRVVDDRGMALKSDKGRVRQFREIWSAMTAADIAAGII